MNSRYANIWNELEKKYDFTSRVQRLVNKKMLFRVYFALDNLPNRRILLIEIPENDASKIESFIDPLGINVKLEKTDQEKEGFITCVIESSSYENNDVFTVVAEDLLNNLINCVDTNSFVDEIKFRLEKWKSFFKNKSSNLLSEQEVIGIFGELIFIEKCLNNGCEDIIEMWNGPIKSAQDFQSLKIAIEIKTTIASNFDKVNISSIEQLDKEDKKVLALYLYQLSANNEEGITLPELIQKIENKIQDKLLKRQFIAKLICLGYDETNAEKYKSKYLVINEKCYDVNDEFPKIISTNVDSHISKVKYQINVSDINNCLIDQNELFKIIGGEISG